MTKPPRKTPAAARVITPELVRQALAAIPPDLARDDWVRVGMAIKSELGQPGFSLWDDWSEQGHAYSATDARDAWRSFKSGGKTTIATLFGMAKENGFVFPDADGVQASAPADPDALERQRRQAQERAQRQAAEQEDYRRRADAAAREAAKLWAEAKPSGRSAYLDRKGVKAHGVRFLAGGTVLVPLRSADGTLHSLQKIAPAKGADGNDKRFLPGGRKSGLWHLIGQAAGAAVVLVGEGYATCATLHEASGHPVAVAFDGGNLVKVARELRALFPAALLLICGDDDRDTEAKTGKNPGRQSAATAARAVHAEGAPAGAVFPEGLPPGGSDFNDLALHAGLAAVTEQIARAVAAPHVPKPRRGQKPPAGEPNAAPDESELVSEPSGPPEGESDPEPNDGPDRFGFLMDEKGVWFIGRDKDGERRKPMWLCAPLHVTARTRADDTNGWGYLLKFTDPDDNPKTWAMPASLLNGEGSEWAARLRDMGLRMAYGGAARNYVAQYIETRELRTRVTCTDRVGWHGGAYVLPSGSIGQAEGRQYVFQSDAGMEDTFRRHGNLAEWQEQVSALCVGNSRLVFAVCSALAGPVLRPSGLESGGFNFRADSRAGKTTGLKVAASVWGRASYMQQWRTTDNALEATAVQHCDGLLILDEFGQLDPRVAGECAYMLANEQEKGRNTRGGLNRKRRTWRLLFLSSGEVGLADQMAEVGKRIRAGQEVRMVDIPLDAGAGMGGLEELHGFAMPAELAEAVASRAARFYGTAGRAWLEWCCEHFTELPELLAGLIERYRREFVPEAASSQVRTVGSRFALVAAAGELATQAGVTGWPAGEAAAAARSCFEAWLGARGHLDNGEEAQMLRQVRAELEKNGDALFTWTHRAMDDHRPNTALRMGFRRLVDDAGQPLKLDAATDYLDRRSTEESQSTAHALVEYLVLPEAFTRQLCKGFQSKAVAELLRKRGHLKHDAGRLASKQRLPGMDKCWVYVIKPSIFGDDL